MNTNYQKEYNAGYGAASVDVATDHGYTEQTNRSPAFQEGYNVGYVRSIEGKINAAKIKIVAWEQEIRALGWNG